MVACTIDSFTIGGMVSGITGTLVLRDNNADDKTITMNGPYTFATPIASGMTYSVSVLTAPPNQYCVPRNAAGTVTSSAITNANVPCATIGIQCDTAYCSTATEECCHPQLAAAGSMCAPSTSSCTGGLKAMHCDDSYDCGGLPNICCAHLDAAGGLVSTACTVSTTTCVASGNQTVSYLCNPVDNPPCPNGMACVADATHGWNVCQ